MKNIDQIVNTLTLDEKVSLLSGFNSWYTNKIEKKDIPSIKQQKHAAAYPKHFLRCQKIIFF